MAKCYFAKHKLVWEVLEQGLKSKIEIQWSDIMALKANCPEDGPGALTLVVQIHSCSFHLLIQCSCSTLISSFFMFQLARQPLFFRETNPQPRKHTLWQATSDFTDGQASMNRYRHFLCSLPLRGKDFV